MQMVFQNADSSLNPRRSVREILEAPLRLYFEFSDEERETRCEELIDAVRLPRSYLDRFPGQLSGGEKQRVGIARAFAAAPEIVLCDEVTSALDVSVQAAVLLLLKQLQESRGAAYVFVSHDLAAVASIADRVGVVYGGRIVEEGSVRDVFYRPQHPYTEGLLASIPGLDLDRLRPIVGDAPPITDLPAGCSFAPRCEYAIDVCRSQLPDPAIEGETIVSCHRSAELTLRGVRD